VLLNEITRGSNKFIYCFNHMHRDPDCPRLIRDSPGYRLPDPPGGISAEFVTPLIFKFVNRLHQSNVSFLNKIKKLETPVRIFFGNTDNKPQVGLNKFGLGVFCLFDASFYSF